jgi:hypothetical protein
MRRNISMKRKLVLRVVDLAAKQGHARPMFLCLADQFESVVGRARASAEDADDEVRSYCANSSIAFGP